MWSSIWDGLNYGVDLRCGCSGLGSNCSNFLFATKKLAVESLHEQSKRDYSSFRFLFIPYKALSSRCREIPTGHATCVWDMCPEKLMQAHDRRIVN